MKGIILAGGTGSRLYPLTLAVNKQLLPVYDKPLIYYPLCTLMSCDIRDILLISSPEALPGFKKLLSDGSHLGLNIAYAEQPAPEGLAQALLIAREFLQGEPCTLILGDNLFVSAALPQQVREFAGNRAEGAMIFAYKVQDPRRYGVVSFAPSGKAVCVEEKPAVPKSPYAVTGLYCFDGRAPDYAATLKPSGRGELEITDLINIYLHKEQLSVQLLERGAVWLDTGTPESLLDASDYVRIIESRQGVKIGCPEEKAFAQGWIDAAALRAQIRVHASTPYGAYLQQLLTDTEALR